MDLWQSVVLGIVEGLTEFLPVSSTGHLTIASGLMGLDISDHSITGFTAVIQVGAILAVIVYFWRDIVRLVKAWFGGLRNEDARGADYREAWMVVIGSIPVGVVGFLAKDVIKNHLRSLWVVAISLIVWSIVMWLADRVATERRQEDQVTVKDGVIMGLAQCLAPLFAGVSRSGATISTGLLLGLNRVTATRLSFLLGVPALIGAGALELPDALKGGVGAAPTAVGTIVSFVVAYASIAWLLKFVQSNKFTGFVVYRIALGILLLAALGTGWMTATGKV